MAQGQGYIVDASVIVKWLNQEREQNTKEAFDILVGAAQGSIELHTSDLAVHEVLNALIRGKGMTKRNLQIAIEAFFQLPLSIIATDEQIAAPAALIAERQKITFYDAIYLALALEFEYPLITANPKDQKSGGGIDVLPLSEWRI